MPPQAKRPVRGSVALQFEHLTGPRDFRLVRTQRRAIYKWTDVLYLPAFLEVSPAERFAHELLAISGE